MITRRTALLAGLGLAGLGLGACTSGLPGDVPRVSPGRFTTGTFRSRYRRTDVTWALSRPPGRQGRMPVLIYLHPRGGDHDSAFGGSLHLDRYLAAAVDHGVPRFAIASIDGGDHEYWHPRSDGDPAGMVVHEFLPLLARQGDLDVRRIGLMGASMGGYGTLYLAERLGRARVAVAVAASPAIWHHAAQTVEGAFDDPADFAAHTVFGHWPGRLDGIPLRIDCGDQDGFAPIVRDFRSRVHPTPAGGISPGGHDTDFWRGQAPAELRFVGTHLHRA